MLSVVATANRWYSGINLARLMPLLFALYNLLYSMDIISKFLLENRKYQPTIYLIGDGLIDEYFSVRINRISPEFPVPIMTSIPGTPIARPGGVANVAYQFKHFNVNAKLVCLLDNYSLEIYNQHNLDITESLHFAEVIVPVKKRFLDNGVQVKRWDVETTNYDCGATLLHDLCKDCFSKVSFQDAGVVIFSDYNKGFFTDCRLVEKYWMSATRDMITIVDPKQGPLDKWKGCTIFKPNRAEARELSGYTDWQDQCRFFKNYLGCKHVVITQGGDGVVGLYNACHFFEFRPKNKVLVESTIGAGDCFVAVFATAIAHNFPVPQAAEIAYRAGEIYVQNRLNRPIVPAELSQTRIVEPEDLRKRDFTLAFANGCFDILHSGHIKTLQIAKESADKLVVAVNSDASVRKLKGVTRPYKNLEERLALLKELRFVDFVISFEEDNPYSIIERCRPDVLVKGADYELAEIVGANLVPKVIQVPLIPDISTTKIIEKA